MINYRILNDIEKNRLLSSVVQVLLTIPEHRCALPVFVLVVAQSIAFCVLLSRQYVSLRSKFHVVMSVTISAYKRCSVRIYRQWFVGGIISCLRCLWFFSYIGIQHILCFWCCFSLSCVPYVASFFGLSFL